MFPLNIEKKLENNRLLKKVVLWAILDVTLRLWYLKFCLTKHYQMIQTSVTGPPDNSGIFSATKYLRKCVGRQSKSACFEKTTRVEIYLRFAVFLRSPVIQLMPPIIFYEQPLLFQEPPMCRYRRFSVENWGWPQLFSNEKASFLRMPYTKNAAICFWYWCRKLRTQSENQISAK